MVLFLCLLNDVESLVRLLAGLEVRSDNARLSTDADSRISSPPMRSFEFLAKEVIPDYFKQTAEDLKSQLLAVRL